MKSNSESFARRTVLFGSSSGTQRGMTLLELLIVVALLSIVALASTSLIVDTGEWKRQQLTEDQWLSIKRSIVGDHVVDANYHREYAGFVTDMGRLPECLRELVRPYDCTPDLDAANRLTDFAQDIDSTQWYGWRGPYLGVPGANEYRDGWRNMGRDDNTLNDDDVNYGWLFGTGAVNGTACRDAQVLQKQAGTLILQSCGDDEDVDNTETGFPGDFPYVEIDGVGNITYIPLITRHDYQVNLRDVWINAPVKIKSKTLGASRIIPLDDLRLRVNYPVVNGRMPDWADALIGTNLDRDTAPFLSTTFPSALSARFVDGAGKVYTEDDGDGDFLTDTPAAAQPVDFVPFATVISSSASSTLVEMPNAVSSALVFDDGSALFLENCPCELLLEPAIAASGTVTTSNTVVSVAIKPGNLAPLAADIGKYWIEVPQGAAVAGTVVTLPNGATLALSRAPDERYFPKLIWDLAGGVPTVTVSEAFTMNGDLITTVSTDDQFLIPSTSIPVGNVITIEKSVPAIPQGLRNVTIVCEADGLLADGDCADNTTAYGPIAVPYQLEVSPRSYVPVPDEIVWDIQ